MAAEKIDYMSSTEKESVDTAALLSRIYQYQLVQAADFLRHNHHADISRVQCLLRKMLPKEYHDLIDELEEDNHVPTNSIAISGGTNFIQTS